MRIRYLIALIAFFVGVTGSSSWAEKVLCIHPGQPASYAHVEGADLSDLSLGELHIGISPDWISSAEKKPLENSSDDHKSPPHLANVSKEVPLKNKITKIPVKSLYRQYNSHLQTVRLII